MPKTKKARTEAQKAAAKKAWVTLRKRLAAERREAIAAGKPPPLTPAQKAWETIRAKKAGKEDKRKANETQLKKDLGHSTSGAHEVRAEVAPSATCAVMPTKTLPTAPNLNQAQPAKGSPVTAMRAAFEKAGVDTARLELEQQVKELLAKNKNKPTGIIVGFDHLILRRRDLREVLLLDYATRIVGMGQKIDDAQSGGASSGNAVGHAPIDAQSGSADRAPGQLDHDIQKASAGGTYKREPVYHVPSPAQKAAARQVMAESLGIWSRKIGDRPIGELTWGELEALRRDSIRHAGKSVETGISRAADGILIGKILLYARVKDMTTLVKDVVPGDVLQRLNHEAAKEAPVVVDIGRIVYERELTNQIEHRA